MTLRWWDGPLRRDCLTMSQNAKLHTGEGKGGVTAGDHSTSLKTAVYVLAENNTFVQSLCGGR